MIPAPLEIAIAEIVAEDEQTLGTGFLVAADGAVLTARHVVDRRTRVGVRFPKRDVLWSTTIEQGEADWAIVDVPVPADLAPLPRGTVGEVAAEVRWHTIGYPAVRDGRGALGGHVRVATAASLDLHCTELVHRTYRDARGISGAPCVIDGEAVALITDVIYDRDTDEIVNGEVRATPLTVIASQTNRVRVEGTSRLPWEDVFASALVGLSDAALLTAAQEAKLKTRVVGARFAAQIARRMINGGVMTTSQVVRQIRSSLDPRKLDEVMFGASTLWVDPMTAHELAAAIDGSTAAVLETEEQWSAEHHVARAYTSALLGPRPWPHVVVEYEEPFREVIADKTRDALLAKYRTTKLALVEKQLAARRHVVLVASVPDQALVDAIRARWPMLAVLFLYRPARSTTPTTIVRFTRQPQPDQEQLARDEYELAVASLDA